MKISNGFRKEIPIILVAFYAFVVRVFYFSRNSFIAGDSYDYLNLAKNLATHHLYGFGEAAARFPSAFRPPLYSFVISLFWGTGNPEWITLLFQAFLGAITVLLVYFLAKRHFGEKIAIISAIFLAIEPFTIHFTAGIMSETLFTFLLVSGLFAFDHKKYALSGLVFGLASLTRPVILPFLLLLLLLSVFKAYSHYRKPVLTVLAITLATISIWTIRNAVVFKEFIPISTTGYGYNLLCGTLDVPMLSDEGWDIVAADPAIKERMQNIKDGMSESKAERELFKKALDRIISNPKEWLRVRAKQYTRLFIDSAPYLLGRNNIRIEDAVRDGNWFFILYKVLLTSRIFLFVGLSLIALLLLRRRLVELSHIVLFPVFLMLIHIPLWTENRYLLPMFPIICILATYTLVTAYDFFRRPKVI